MQELPVRVASTEVNVIVTILPIIAIPLLKSVRFLFCNLKIKIFYLDGDKVEVEITGALASPIKVLAVV